MEVSLYHLTTTSVERTLPKLLEKIYTAGLRSLVLCDSQEHVRLYDTTLWTYSPGAFLPHGYTGTPLDHPIWLSTNPQNKNNATVLILTAGQEDVSFDSYSRCLDLFDGNESLSFMAAQKRRQNYQNQGYSVTYWKQTLQGGWEAEKPTDALPKN